MQNTFWLLLFLLLGNAVYVQSQNDSAIYLADPTIFHEDGTYYLYGTGGKDGFLVYTSTDLENWTGPIGANDGYALIKGDSYGDKGFWAPQVFRYNNRYYMAYTANEFIAIASSDNPLGPFRQEKIAKLPAETRQIDPYIFFDEDGKIYLFHVRLTEGNRLFVAEMNKELTDIIPGTLTECIIAVEDWEHTRKEQFSWPVAEGPTIIKKDGTYYFFYSTNDFRNIDYAVGYATSKSPYGPWIKHKDNPIISRHLLKQNGTGHGDLFVDSDNNLQYVLHTHYSDKEVSPRRTAIVTMKVSQTSAGYLFNALPETFRFLHTAE